MKQLVALACAVLFVLAAAIVGQEKTRNATDDDRDSKATAQVVRLDKSNWDEFAPEGKEADAIYGDFVLRNKYITAVVANVLDSRHANMTVRDVGGALIDLTQTDLPNDQLSCFYPGARKYPFRSALVKNAAGSQVRLTVYSESAEGRPTVEVDYTLKAADRYLTVTTRFINNGTKPLKIPLTDDIRADAGNERMGKSPNGTSELFWVHDEFWGQAYGVTAGERRVESNSNSRTSVLKYQGPDDNSEITLAAGKTFEFTRQVIPATNLVNVRAIAGALRDRKSIACRLLFRDGLKRPMQHARVSFQRDGQDVGSGTTSKQGRLNVSLPKGSYSLSVTALGVAVGEDLEFLVEPSEKVIERKFQIDTYRPGTVEGRITNSDGAPLPCKIAFHAKVGTSQPDFGPNSAEFAVRSLCYAPHGRFSQDLPVGNYDVIISRGVEYDAVFTELAVQPGQTTSLTAKLQRTVQTGGWVSSDFHSHSSPSGDNTGSQLGRVLNLVCEHIEFAPCTEHNRISSYDDHIADLKVQAWISTVSGMELTGQPLPLNHQNTFPLIHKPRHQDGGGPVTDTSPETQIERIALWDNRSEKLIQQNHPDIGWLFYDRDGNGKPDNGFERSFQHINAMEIHPISNALRLVPFETLAGRKGNNRIFNWLQLLNQGIRIVGVVNTDAHYNFHGSGGLRNWIQSSTDDPSKIDAMEMVKASKEGRLIMSNGPFLEVSMSRQGDRKTITAGQDLAAANGNVTLHARVQCPNWFDIDHVFVLVNGRVHQQHDYTRHDHPERFRDGAVKFDQRLQLELKSDAHIIVVAGGEKSTLGLVFGDFWGKFQPAAMSNPMYVDVDGGGFQTNKDTLGHPLPVKFGVKK